MARRAGDRPRRKRTRAGRVFSALSWPAALGLLVLGACWPAAGAAWQLDLVANLNAQWLLAAAPLTALWCLTRRWWPAGIGAAACLLLIVPLATGRAAWVAPLAPGKPAGAVRIYHYNASTRGEGPEIEAAMNAAGADVLSLLCPPVRYQRDVIYGHGLEDRYPGKLVRMFRAEADGGGTDVTAAVLVSRWPVSAIDTRELGDMASYLIAGSVERPAAEGGPFAVIAIHPRSPRNPARWRVGNLVIEATAALANRLRSQGQAVVVIGDLNSTPSGWRSRALWRLAGLRRGKPLLSGVGTYPLPAGPRDDTAQGPTRGAPWPLSIALDDVVVSPGIRIAGWGRLGRMSSEHNPIVVDLVIPRAAASDAAGAGR